MSRHDNFKDESQDARRHDQHQVVHPDDKPHHGKAEQKSTKSPQKKDEKK